MSGTDLLPQTLSTGGQLQPITQKSGQRGRRKRGTPDRHYRHEGPWKTVGLNRHLTSYHRVGVSGIQSGHSSHKPQSQKWPEKLKAKALKTLFSFLKCMCERNSTCAHTCAHACMDVWGGWAHATVRLWSSEVNLWRQVFTSFLVINIGSRSLLQTQARQPIASGIPVSVSPFSAGTLGSQRWLPRSAFRRILESKCLPSKHLTIEPPPQSPILMDWLAA